jgi:hypothetical protein
MIHVFDVRRSEAEPNEVSQSVSEGERKGGDEMINNSFLK